MTLSLAWGYRAAPQRHLSAPPRQPSREEPVDSPPAESPPGYGPDPDYVPDKVEPEPTPTLPEPPPNGNNEEQGEP
jgi:hypothetical protein